MTNTVGISAWYKPNLLSDRTPSIVFAFTSSLSCSRSLRIAFRTLGLRNSIFHLKRLPFLAYSIL
nr:hypothetical protein [uncultured bacterium]